ncbi:MAG: T9SS type A sorting domain-containing protein [Bacteroidales bacterium]|nr:T9SS type A sorting domain-containing protein [Bacteroidales bacterium]
MKKIALVLMFVLVIQYIYAQNAGHLVDIAPNVNTDFSPAEILSPWETIFIYPTVDTAISTGVETDGQHYYVCGWSVPYFQKYDMQGNLIELFTVPGINSMRDMAYDGQYFYGGPGLGGNTLHVVDLDNKVLVESWMLPFNVRAIAYNDDLDVFYANDWYSDIMLIGSDGSILDTIPLGVPRNYYGFAYDNWSDGGPYLWGFSHDGPSTATLVQLELPSCEETGFIMDLGYLGATGGYWAGGLFTYPDTANDRVIIGGVAQNESFFGLELGLGLPPPVSGYAVSYLHSHLYDSTDVLLNWAPARYYLINEYFDNPMCPPFGWEEETYNGQGSGWDGMVPNYVYWPIPEIDSRFAIAYEDLMSNQRCCDYLISPEIELNSQYDYYLSFESYYDGSNNHSGYVKYSLDDGQNWILLHTMVPDSGEWVKIKLDLTPIPNDLPVKIAFHSDDNWGDGSGWAINNVMVYTEDIPVSILGYDVYRDGLKVNSSLIVDTSYIDVGLSGGTHEYYISAVYQDGSMNSGDIEIFVPHYPPPPPSPDCNPPQNLQANVIYPLDNGDILLEWNSPEMTVTKDNAWDVQFIYPLAGEDEAGFTCDGNYFYTTYLKDSDFGQYDLQGNYLYNAPMFTPGARNLEYVPLTENTYVTFERYFGTEIIKLPGGQWQGNFPGAGGEFAIAYNEDLDAFYINNNSSDILLIDRQTGNFISSFICRTHGNYYDFAYDKWSEGGPYLWGFSADGPNGCTLVQISLPDGLETGFTYDASWLSPSGNAVPGGLFIMEDLIPGTVSLCGLIQGEVMFGLELGPAEWDFYLGGYNIYMDNNLHNPQLVTDTIYTIQNPGPGTYNFEVSAVYVDSIGDVLCESDKDGPVEVSIVSDVFIIGGNVIAGAYKLDEGEVNLYRFEGDEIEDQFTTNVDELAYYLFPDMTEGYYMMHAKPGIVSSFADSYVPTYHGGQIHWEEVTPAYINENSYTNDINLVEMAILSSGEGFIGGNIYDQLTDNEIPLQGAQVMLLNTENECIAIDYSNSNGEFSFNDLAFDTYKLLVEIAGVSMNPIIIILSSSEPEESDINLYVISGEIVMGIDDEFPDWIDYISEIYPNPAKHGASINIRLNKPSSLKLSIFNTSGQVMQEELYELDQGQSLMNINLQNLSSGVFYVYFRFSEGFTLTRKLLILE